MNWSFVSGMLCGINLAGVVYFFAWRRQRDVDRDFRARTVARLDELSEWNARQYEQARRDIGLAPRVRS